MIVVRAAFGPCQGREHAAKKSFAITGLLLLGGATVDGDRRDLLDGRLRSGLG